jgi:2-polyprenyl-3-methyl-5-hydroxy-6-metoxy-1,4-benzoquinol methylase
VEIFEINKMSTYTTEIASDQLESDNPIHQRLLKAYIAAAPHIAGSLLEVGCGEGRGVEVLSQHASDYLGLDKIEEVIHQLTEKFPHIKFRQAVIPPFHDIADHSFDRVVSFQVIEHIQNDELFLKEIYRVLKPGGFAMISTPNIKHTLSRNPWHVREYTVDQLKTLCENIFDQVVTKGIGGNDKVWQYHEANRVSVQRIMRFDVFKLQYRLPAFVLRWPYEILNRFNRNKLHQITGSVASSIHHEDYLVKDNAEEGLDLFYFLYKKL